MGVSINTTICITKECKYQFQFQYEGQWKQPFHIKRMHWANQTISWNKEGTFFPRKNPTSGAWNGCGVCSSGVASQERWAVRIQGGGEERRATTLAPPPPEPAPECHTAREPGSQGNTERRAWVRHFQGLGTTTIATTDISTTMVTTKIETTKNLDHIPRP